ncbi:uncharacterized protein LOC117892527 isoform X3 [Drosophila subobscura]|uniref:uncharacterized protein LOC117892527 isoform X3 n=1 Tax=Drosophila subobscura TaxID=7241 RepID=UPI00155A8EE0|nr:uncharacterized protein LOC117892527 isoform X3 [Drosophila subobscura]
MDYTPQRRNMSHTPNSEVMLVPDATPSPSPLAKLDVDFSGSNYEMHSSLSDEERRYYLKEFPSVDTINQRKVHCTVCKLHMGTAPGSEASIKMHPILRVTHCVKCHEFYNSGEFSKGEDGSELYCRWCGQGGEVYCCSTCPYVFCKSCIVKNLSRGVIVDIEQNENWNCFSCTPKILWPLRAQHWALVNYIQTQKRGLQSLQLPEKEARRQMMQDNSVCCRLAKAKSNSLSDSAESLESTTSKRSHNSSVSSAKKGSSAKLQGPPTKRPKASNDEVVCTPDLLSMLEPDCQISMPQKPAARLPVSPANITKTPRIVTVQQNYTGPSPSPSSNGKSPPRLSLPPPLVLSGSGVRYRQSSPASVVRRTVVPNSVRNTGPVFHTINGFRVDLNSAAQQDSYRLPNGRLIQVKRQMPLSSQPATALTPPTPMSVGPLGQVIIRPRSLAAAPPTIRQVHSSSANSSPGGTLPSVVSNMGNNMGIYNPQINQQQRAPQGVRVGNVSQTSASGSANASASGGPLPTVGNGNGGEGTLIYAVQPNKAPALMRHVFPNSSIGQARAQLQEQIFNAMDICTHLTGKVISLTHSNAYNQARSFMDLKELYIHMSYLMTYAIGRFKHLQDKCLVDMRDMGFKNDANSLENGQLAAEKQASDDEDNEIEIVEPKTDTITIDSDNEDEACLLSSSKKIMKITSVSSHSPKIDVPKREVMEVLPSEADMAAFSSTILASLLEVEITDGTAELKNVSPGHKKQPRKKTTNRPNPALLQLERQRMEEIKLTDAKLKKKVVVKLRRAEEEFEVARKWAKNCDKQAKSDRQAQQAKHNAEKNPVAGPKEPISIEVEKESDHCIKGGSSPSNPVADKETEKPEAPQETSSKNDKSDDPKKEFASDDNLKIGDAADRQHEKDDSEAQAETEPQPEPEAEAGAEAEDEAQSKPDAVDEDNEKELLSINPVVGDDMQCPQSETDAVKDKSMDTSTETPAAVPLESMDIDVPIEKTEQTKDEVDESKELDGIGVSDRAKDLSPIAYTAEAKAFKDKENELTVAEINPQIVASETNSATLRMPLPEPILNDDQNEEICEYRRESVPITENEAVAGFNENVERKLTPSDESSSNGTATGQIIQDPDHDFA